MVHGVVVGLDAEAHAALEVGQDPCRLGDLDGLDAHARDGEVLVGGGDLVRSHGDGVDLRERRGVGGVEQVFFGSWYRRRRMSRSMDCAGITESTGRYTTRKDKEELGYQRRQEESRAALVERLLFDEECRVVDKKIRIQETDGSHHGRPLEIFITLPALSTATGGWFARKREMRRAPVCPS
ncbi:hypothetical protein VTK73DRAFT_3167 [Phialemonium thermophilum]|uniref:Uncharacterized protein n=1 Tax=Phialemonium thermophilum TaxID=223376 RepID=A0ABR3VLJ6_9PEZI